MSSSDSAEPSNECGARYPEDRALYVCPSCTRLQLPGGFTRGVLRVELAEGELPRRWPDSPLASPEGLAPFVPVRGPESSFSFVAGGTPLLPVPRLRQALGMPRLYLKDDTRNPSGFTKDRASGGCGVLVSEDAILDAIPRLAAATGVFAEPAAAIALAGLEPALAEGNVARDERVVLLVTGTGLKDVPAAARRVRVPEPVEPTMRAVEALFC